MQWWRSTSRSLKQHISLITHQPSTAAGSRKRAKFLIGAFLCGIIFLLLISWALSIRIMSSLLRSPDVVIPENVVEASQKNVLYQTKHEDELRVKALKAAREETEKLQNQLEKDREELDTLKNEQQPEEEEDQEEEEEGADYYYYYEDNNTEEGAVLGMANVADFIQIKRFVGSLRYHGFKGHVIIGVHADIDVEILQYLRLQAVTVKLIKASTCVYDSARPTDICYNPYPNIKREWAVFPLARDWLASCEDCTGPVLFTTVHNVFFQANPFGVGMPMVKRLQLFQEHWDVKYGKQSPTAYLLQACKDIDHRTNELGYLSSEIAVGHRDDMNEYLSTVYYQTKVWMAESKCHFKHASLDTGQAIINFMRLSDRLPYHTRFKAHRKGLVNIVGYEGKLAYEAHLHFWRFKGLSEEEAEHIPYEGAEGNNWIDSDYKLTDSDGYFIDIYFRRSAIVHEYDKFGQPYLTWLDNNIGKTFSCYIYDPNNSGNDESGGKNITKEFLEKMTPIQRESYAKVKKTSQTMDKPSKRGSSNVTVTEDISKVEDDGTVIQEDSEKDEANNNVKISLANSVVERLGVKSKKKAKGKHREIVLKEADGDTTLDDLKTSKQKNKKKENRTKSEDLKAEKSKKENKIAKTSGLKVQSTGIENESHLVGNRTTVNDDLDDNNIGDDQNEKKAKGIEYLKEKISKNGDEGSNNENNVGKGKNRKVTLDKAGGGVILDGSKASEIEKRYYGESENVKAKINNEINEKGGKLTGNKIKGVDQGDDDAGDDDQNGTKGNE